MSLDDLDSDHARTRQMPAIHPSSRNRLITEHEYHLNMVIGCTLSFGLGVLVATIAYVYVIA